MRNLLAAVTVFGLALAVSAPATADDAPPENPPVTAATATAAKVDLNSATVEALGKLDGITPARARAIIENRCYESAMDLVDRRILPKSVVQKIKDRVEVSTTCVRDEPDVSGEPKKPVN